MIEGELEVESSLVGLSDFKSGVSRRKSGQVGSIPMHFRQAFQRIRHYWLIPFFVSSQQVSVYLLDIVKLMNKSLFGQKSFC